MLWIAASSLIAAMIAMVVQTLAQGLYSGARVH
jgi:hypothetical protein